MHWPAGAFASYAPRAPETVVFSLPGEALRSGVPLVVGQLLITVDAGSVSMSSPLIVEAVETDLRSLDTHTIELTLTDDTWVPSIGLDGPASTALVNGLSSAQQEARGFNAIVRPSIDLVRVDASTVRLTIPQRAD